MDFFQAQESARKRTRLLVFLYVAAVAALVVTLYLAVSLASAWTTGRLVFDPVLFAWVAGGTVAIVGLGSLYKTGQLRKGGSHVAAMLGGRPVRPDSTDPDERRLRNVVEEMAIASGTPVPEIFVLYEEPGINAFAAGHALDDAAVAVTRGTLERLSRDELQGVIAHEFSHIMNGDMRLNIRLMGLLHGILMLAILGRVLLRSTPRSSGRGGGRGRGWQVGLIGVALLVVGYIGVLFGKLIQAAVSRQREYLADSSAVQFTRDPDGIAGALRKIGGATAGSRIRDPRADEAAHFFFASGVRSFFGGLLATHPPLAERIRRVDPSWDGEFEIEAAADASSLREERESAVSGLAGRRPRRFETASGRSVASAAAPGDAAAAVLGSVGAPSGEHVDYAARLLQDLPAELDEALHEPRGAAALVCALLMGGGAATEEAQRDLLRREDEALATRVEGLREPVRSRGEGARLTLLDLALPALRKLSPEQGRELQDLAGRLIGADGRVRTFEYALLHILGRNLPKNRSGPSARRRTVHSFRPLRGDVETLLSALARSGTGDEAAATRAFAAGRDLLPDSAKPLELRSAASTNLGAVDRALEELGAGAPSVRRRLLAACAHVVSRDGRIEAREAELLRAVSESLEAPMPPILEAGPDAGRGALAAGSRRSDPAPGNRTGRK